MVSCVQSRRLRELRAALLYSQGGLLQTTHVKGDHLVWANSRSHKRWSFVDKGLIHFIDDQVEVCASIRAACWEQRGRARPPALFLVPTGAGGVVTLGGRVLMPPAPARAGGRKRRTYPQITVGRVCPWDPDGRPGTRPLTANFRRTREGGKTRSRLRLSHVHQ